MFNPVETGLVAGKPRDRSDRCRKKEKAIAEPPSSTGLPHRQRGHDRNSRKIVVGETRVADVTGNQHLVRRFTGKKELAVGERSRRNIAVDFDALVVVKLRLLEI